MTQIHGARYVLAGLVRAPVSQHVARCRARSICAGVGSDVREAPKIPHIQKPDPQDIPKPDPHSLSLFTSMIVHYYSSSTLPSTAANSVHVMKIAAALARLGHDVTVFGRAPSESTATDVFELYGVRQRFAITLTTAPRLRVAGPWIHAARTRSASLRAAPPQLIWARNLQSAVLMAGNGVPIVYESHSPPPSRHDHLLERHLFRSPQFARLVVISAALAKEYRAVHPRLDPARVMVAHDGADPMSSSVVTPGPALQVAPRL